MLCEYPVPVLEFWLTEGVMLLRIGMMLDTRFPPDIRVEKEISVLRSEHMLHILCPRRDKQAWEEMVNGTHVHRVFSTPRRWWENIRLMATCSSSGWQHAIERFVTTNQIQVLHVHDLPLLGPALTVGHKLGLPVVSDLHEDYPAMLAGELGSLKGSRLSPSWLIQRWIVSIERWRRYEASTVMQADAVIAVIEESRDRLVALGIPAERVHVVANYVPLADLHMESNSQSTPSPDKFKVLYAGGFDSARDLHTVIDAVAGLLTSDMPNLSVTLLGGTDRSVGMLRDYAESQGVSDRVDVLAWRPIQEVFEHILDSSVCLVPHVKTSHTDTTIPHKLFQYMACERPVIVSNCAPLARIVSETGAGLVYTSGNARELSDCLHRLYLDPQLRQRTAQQGYCAVRERYNWEQTGHVLRELYRGLAKRTTDRQNMTMDAR